MIKDKKPQILVLVICLVFLIIFSTIINFKKINNTATKITGTLNIDNGDEKINWSRYETKNISLSNSLEITNPGTYYLTGELYDGSIKINVSKNEPVKLILDNVNIKNHSGPAISCLEADDLVIELKGENNIEDAENYGTEYDIDVTGAIYSKADLTFEGDGVLNLTANYQDGIIGKDDLKFKSGTYNIVAKDDAIRGKDSVYIIDGEYNLESNADAIKSTNEFTDGKGFVFIENGSFKIKSGAKGIKSINSILIYGGDFDIVSYDDAIHSNNYVGIINGAYKINSGDDGIHADRELVIDGGDIVIERSYEGLEAQVVTINGGKVSLLTSDDGINAGGGADASATNRPGANSFKADENCNIIINGGDIYINAAGDGVDSNGSIFFNGGKVVVDGPTNNNNGSLDSELGITMTGGEVIAVGASGMATNLGEKSTIYNISVYFDETKPANTKLEIKDSLNKTILEHISKKSFSHLSAGSEKFIPGETYAIYLNDEKYQNFTVSNIVTLIGEPYMKQNMMPRR